MKTIGFIPVRCGSKSIEFKNIKLFNNKPLVYWVIKALAETKQVDEIVLATDCEKIKEVVLSFGFLNLSVYDREIENAADTSSTEDVMLEYIQSSSLEKNDVFILLQATSPLTMSLDIENGLSKFHTSQYQSILSAVRIKRFFWTEDGESENYDYKNRPRRQDFNGQLVENGAFYINTVGNIIESKNRLSEPIGIQEMPEYTFVEIDEEIDWVIAEKLMQKYSRGNIKSKEIKLLLSDVDGVLTDAGMYYSEKGDELKRFSTYDGMGFKILQENNILTGIITSEDVELNRNRANKLKLDYQFHGVKDKLKLVTSLLKELGISFENVAYIGDDINDFQMLSSVGLAACPANAVAKIKDIQGIIHLEKKGGEGAVREFIEKILSK